MGFQEFLDLLQRAGEESGLMDLHSEELDDWVPTAVVRRPQDTVPSPLDWRSCCQDSVLQPRRMPLLARHCTGHVGWKQRLLAPGDGVYDALW